LIGSDQAISSFGNPLSLDDAWAFPYHSYRATGSLGNSMIIRHARRDRKSPVDPRTWPAIPPFFHGNGAASPIAPTWLLTAAPVARPLPAGQPFSVELCDNLL
jgi:hypothetical protein